MDPKRYLVYDASCSVCTHLAQTIEVAAHGKLGLTDINGEQARAWLDRAFPKGWIRAPYLVYVGRKQIHAWTGLSFAIRLATLAGPAAAWRIWSEARRTGVFAPPGTKLPFANIASRRNMLKAGATMAGVIGMASLQQRLSPLPVDAQSFCCCQQIYGCFRCTYYGYQCGD